METVFPEQQTMSFSLSDVKINIHFDKLNGFQRKKVHEEIKSCINHFESIFGQTTNLSNAPINIYIFNDRDDYQYYGKKQGLSDEGGKFYPTGFDGKGEAEIYVYQQGDIHNLSHEMAHALTYRILPHADSLPKALIEGIGEYVQYKLDHKFNQLGNSIEKIQSENLTISDILMADYNRPDATYQGGHMLITYLIEKKPQLLTQCLEPENLQQIPELLKKEQSNFEQWQINNSTQRTMEEINALKVTEGDLLCKRKELIGNEIKEVEYYRANIMNKGKEIVGEFSQNTHYILDNNWIRNADSATGIQLDIKLSDYQYVKVVKDGEGDIKLTYSDEKGNEYKDSQNYKNKVDRTKTIYANRTGYDTVSAEQIEESMASLTYIDPKTLTNEGLAESPVGTLFSIQNHGTGMMSAISLHQGNKKVSELTSEYGIIKKIDGEAKFLLSNRLDKMHISYNVNEAYIAVEKKGEIYTADFVDGRPVHGDSHFPDQPHLHKNELLSPSINVIDKNKLPDLLLEKTQILSHQESTKSQYSSEQKQYGLTIEKGLLLDSKGTEKSDDDIHQAVITQNSNPLHKLNNIGFYITEEFTDKNGQWHNSKLFIHDHGKNHREQFPEEFTFVKLIKIGEIPKLAVCDKDGNLYTDIKTPEEFRFINTDCALTYEKQDHSHKLVTTGFIDFSAYPEDAIFKLVYDPNAYNISKDEQGEVIRPNDTPYYTNVKIIDIKTDKAVGMLPNTFDNYQGEHFYSADYNYSYKDFLVSTAPQVKVQEQKGDSTLLSFTQSDADIGDTDHGYTHHKIIPIQGKQFDSIVTLDYQDIKKVYDAEQNPETREKMLQFWKTIEKSHYTIDTTTLPEYEKKFIPQFLSSRNTSAHDESQKMDTPPISYNPQIPDDIINQPEISQYEFF